MANYGVPAQGRWLPSVRQGLSMLVTFMLITFALIFFRAPDLQTAIGYVQGLVGNHWGGIDVERRIWLFIAIMLLAEWLQRDKVHPLQLDGIAARPVRWLTYVGLVLVTFYYGAPPQTFIYFQF
jgi:hypothetical protein